MKEIRIQQLAKSITKGGEITKREALELTKTEQLETLFEEANKIRKFFMGNKVDLCTIMNAKSGKCSEDCTYCAQSAHYTTNVLEYSLISYEQAYERAKENASYGVHHFSLVTSGRSLEGEDFNTVVETFKKLNKTLPKLKLCASHGIIDNVQGQQLKEAGVKTYHHNLETSRSYYGKICTTHSYDERLKTIKEVQKAGLSVCSGGIIGMGESWQDRIELAFALKKLGIRSVPINILNPVEGTPLGRVKTLEPTEILRTMAIFRFILPKAFIRYAGGRGLLGQWQEKGLEAGVNAALVGNYLTTVGNNIREDLDMVMRKGFEYKA